MIAIYFFLSSIIAPNFIEIGSDNYNYYIMNMSVYFTVFFLMTLGGGPFTAGFSYVIRNFSREEHAFVVSDFFEHTRKNLKQSFLVTIIDIFLIVICFININFYSTATILNPSFTFIAKVIMIIFFLMYLIARMYLYSLMVTFDSRLFKLYKLSYMLTILKLPQMILMFIINIAIYSLFSFASIQLFAFILTPFFLLSLTYLSQSIYTTAVIKENVLFDNKDQDKNNKQIFSD